MDREKVLQSLAELETHLQNVKNATDQVNSVVKAAETYTKAANELVKSNSELLKQIKEISVDGYKEVKDAALDAIKKSTSEVSTMKTQCVQDIKNVITEEKEILDKHALSIENAMNKAVTDAVQTLESSASGLSATNASIRDVVENSLIPTVSALQSIVDNNLSTIAQDIANVVSSESKAIKKQSIILSAAVIAMIVINILITFVR